MHNAGKIFNARLGTNNMRRVLLIALLLPLLTGCEMMTRSVTMKLTPGQSGQVKGLVIGQSNAVSGDGEPIVSATGKVIISDEHDLVYTPSESHPAQYWKAWVMLGDMLVGTYGGPVTFYCRARGGTSTRQWVNDDFDILTRAVDSARKEQPDFAVWVQGENDAAGYIPDSEAYDNMKVIFGKIKQVSPRTKIFIALDGTAAANYDSGIVIAQQRLIREGYVFQGADMQLIRMTDANRDVPGLGLHLSDQGMHELASQFFTAISRVQPWRE